MLFFIPDTARGISPQGVGNRLIQFRRGHIKQPLLVIHPELVGAFSRQNNFAPMAFKPNPDAIHRIIGGRTCIPGGAPVLQGLKDILIGNGMENGRYGLIGQVLIGFAKINAIHVIRNEHGAQFFIILSVDPLNGCLFSKTGVFLCGFFYPKLF